MATYLLLAIVALCAFRSMAGWRTGLLLVIVIAAIQDPFRKLIPGAPTWASLSTFPVFAMVIFVSASKTRGWWTEFRKFNPNVAQSLRGLMLLSLPAAVISASYSSGSWQLTILGAVSYSWIFLAMIVGFHYPRRLQDLRKLLMVYCLAHGVMLSGGIFQFLGWFPGWRILGDDAIGFKWLRQIYGYDIHIISGFYRSGDVMGWHAAAVSLMSLLLAWTGRGTRRYFWVFLSAFAIGALMLCGRRKMVYLIPVFAIGLIWLYWQAGRAARVWAVVGLLAVPFASVWIGTDLLGEGSAQIHYYSTGRDESLDQIQDHGFTELGETYDQVGFFGAGLGTATPGSHNIHVDRPHTWQEGGATRVLVELGVPGAVGFLAVMVTILLSLWRVTKAQLRARTPQGHYAAGLVSFFLANVGSLVVSGQILADPFIASFLGFMIGLTLSLERPQLAAIPANALAQPAVAPRAQVVPLPGTSR